MARHGSVPFVHLDLVGRIQHGGPGTDATPRVGIKSLVVEPVDPLAPLVEGTLVGGARKAEIGNQRLPGPFTTQPMMETSIGVMMSSSRSSRALTVPMTSNS